MMKKKLLSLLMCFMLVGAGSAFAAASSPDTTDPTEDELVAYGGKFELMKEFQDEIHNFNNLRIVRLETKTQIVQKQSDLYDLTLAAKENGNKEGLIEAANIHKQIRSIHEEIGNLRSSLRTELKAFKQAVKDNDSDLAQTHINSAISILSEINGKWLETSGLYDQMIEILN